MFLYTNKKDPPPSPPFFHVQGLVNVRDIGGYKAPSPSGKYRSLRHGLVYRGGEPNRITPEGKHTIKSLGITKVFDIRTKEELAAPMMQRKAQRTMAGKMRAEGPLML